MKITIELSKKEIEALIVCVKLAQIHLDDDVVLTTNEEEKIIKEVGGIDNLQNKLESFKKK